MDLPEYIHRLENVVITYAIKTNDGILGSVCYSTPNDFKKTLQLSNLYDVSFLPALKMGKGIGLQIHQYIDIIAIEIIEDMVLGESFTAPLKEKCDDILSEVSSFIETIIQKFSSKVEN